VARDIQYANILLFLSDAAPYVVKAVKSIQLFYLKVTEEIRRHFSKVDKFI